MSVAALAVKATLLLGLMLAASTALGRLRASRRHAVLAAGFIALLVMPAVALLLPPIGVSVPAATPFGLQPRARGPAARTTADPAEPAAQSRTMTTRQTPAGNSWTVIAAAWAAGTALSLVPFLTGHRRARAIRRTARPWNVGACAQLPVAIRLFRHEDVVAPCTFGAIRPVVVFPEDATAWTEAELLRALRHEAEHVRRHDWLVQCAARLACALHWYHPLAWLAFRQLRLDAERACDDVAIEGTDAAAYASQLLATARQLAKSRTAALSMAGRSDLAARVHAVLDERRARGRAGRAWSAGCVIAAMLALIAIAPLSAVGAFDAARLTRSAAAIVPFANEPTARMSKQTGGVCGALGIVRSSDTCFVAQSQTLHDLALFAFGPHGLARPITAVLGGPDWLPSDRFDLLAVVHGTVPFETTPDDRVASLTGRLLARRFGLSAHRETRMGSMLSLRAVDVNAHPGRKAPAPPCVAHDTEGSDRQRFLCAATAGTTAFRGLAANIPQLADFLANRLDRPVRDDTRLRGPFAIDLSWTGGQAALSTALRDQVGLTLAPIEGPVEVLVVDRVTRPRLDEGR
jgi:uncharacterized protein (TIGR03435 family)